MKLTRREFIKLTGLASAATVTLRHANAFGEATNLPLFGDPANQGVHAAVCSLCPLGCGLNAHVQDGTLLDLAANPDHPLGWMAGQCTLRRQAVSKQYSPDRLSTPLKRGPAGLPWPISWDAAIGAVQRAWQAYSPDQVAFLVGAFPDHVFDLVKQIAGGLGGASVLRYSAYSEFSGWATLMDAAQKLFGISQIPYFDVQRAALVLCFGDNPVHGRQSAKSQDAHWIRLSPHRAPDQPEGDEWIPILPGSEAQVAGALAVLVAGISGRPLPAGLATVDVRRAAQAAGLPPAVLHRLAALFAGSARKVALPGSTALGQVDGLAAAEAILKLNIAADNLGKEGGLCLTPEILAAPASGLLSSTFAEIKSLVERLRSGRIKVLFVHGVDPFNELPPALEFAEALDSVELLISFSPYMDGTARRADYILPDSTVFENWGYHRLAAGAGRPGLSIWQPLVPAFYNSRSTAAVLLAAVQKHGGDLAGSVPFLDTAGFVKSASLAQVNKQNLSDTGYKAWLLRGGWWTESPARMAPVQVGAVGSALSFPKPSGLDQKKESLWLAPSFSPDGGEDANMTISPGSAHRFGLRDRQKVQVISSCGQVKTKVCISDGVVDGVVVLPVWSCAKGQQSALGLLGCIENQSGNLVHSIIPVQVEKIF
ncbi:molybdopterin-dependent oxidoreductase [Chloroflexota bacterium]